MKKISRNIEKQYILFSFLGNVRLYITLEDTLYNCTEFLPHTQHQNRQNERAYYSASSDSGIISIDQCWIKRMCKYFFSFLYMVGISIFLGTILFNEKTNKNINHIIA